MKNEIDWKIIVTALVCITALEIYALSQGFNGTILKTVLVVLAGIAGWSLPQLKIRKV